MRNVNSQASRSLEIRTIIYFLTILYRFQFNQSTDYQIYRDLALGPRQNLRISTATHFLLGQNFRGALI